jgi:hypothetical protein
MYWHQESAVVDPFAHRGPLTLVCVIHWRTRLVTREGGSEWEPIKFFLKRTRPISQLQLRESHANKRKHTQTFLETLGTRLEWLGSKAEASTKELEQQRRRLRPTRSTGTSDLVTLSLTEPHRVTRAQMTGSTYPLQVTWHKWPNHLRQPRKLPANPPQTLDQWISETTWSLETKFWGDDEQPKERLCTKNYGLKLPTTPRIANPCQEHYDLGFLQKSTNQRPNPVFEESRSSTKRHKALTHDPLKEIIRETPSNRRTERWMKNPRKGSENHQKEKMGRTHPSLEGPRRIIYTYQSGS